MDCSKNGMVFVGAIHHLTKQWELGLKRRIFLHRMAQLLFAFSLEITMTMIGGIVM